MCSKPISRTHDVFDVPANMSASDNLGDLRATPARFESIPEENSEETSEKKKKEKSTEKANENSNENSNKKSNEKSNETSNQISKENSTWKPWSIRSMTLPKKLTNKREPLAGLSEQLLFQLVEFAQPDPTRVQVDKHGAASLVSRIDRIYCNLPLRIS